MRQALNVLLIVVLVGAGYLLLAPGGRQFIDRAYVKWTRGTDLQSCLAFSQPMFKS